MSRPLAAAQPDTTGAAQPNVIVAAPVRYDATTPRLNPTPSPFAGPFPNFGPLLPAPYPAPFYPMGPPSAFPPVMPPGTFPGPRVDLPLPPPPGVLGPYPVEPRYITQHSVCTAPPGYPPSLIYAPTGDFSYQEPALSHGIVDPVTISGPPLPLVAPPDLPQFKIYIGKIAPTVDNDFVLSLLQVCGVVKCWEPATNRMDGTRTGFGFCEFESAEGSLRAKRLLNKLIVDGQELVVNVNQPARDYFEKYGEHTSEGKAKEGETETRDAVVSLADDGNASAIPDVTARGTVGGQMSTKGQTKECQNGTEDTDKDAMQRIHSLIKERMKSKLVRSPTPTVQVSACIVDENGDDDTGSGALEEHLGERTEGQKGREVTAAGMSSLRIDEAPSMHVPMECQSKVEHERRSQHRARDGFRKSNGEEKGREITVGSQSQKDREGTAAGKSSLQILAALRMHVPMERESKVQHKKKIQLRERYGFPKSSGAEKGRESKDVGSEGKKDREVAAARMSSLQIDEVHARMECESTIEHERKNQHRGSDGFRKSNWEERRIEFVPGLVSDEQNISAVEKVGIESQGISNSGEKTTLDAKQLLATVPKTKEELFAHDVNWAVYDKYGLHERMRPWIAKKATEAFGEELAEFVDYVVESTKEHVTAPRMLELLESLLDDDAEKFVLLMWRKLIFEIKNVEEGFA